MGSGYNESDNFSFLMSFDQEYYLKGIPLPVLGIIGIVGNSMNLIVLRYRYKKRDIDILEKGALLGLIALAFSDLLFCFGLLPQMYFYRSRIVFSGRGLALYHQMFYAYYGNVFIKISTGLTLLVGVARFVGICYPLQLNARFFIGLKGIRIAIGFIYFFWITALIPMWWNYKIIDMSTSSIDISHIDINHSSNTNTTTFVYLDVGPIAANRLAKLTFTYLWTCLGYFLPVTILVYCNIKLILVLRESAKLRKMTVSRHSSNHKDYTRKITRTLVLLILSFIILVSPSEIMHFYADVVQPENYPSFEVAVHCTNILQAINFAFHFLLYFAVNASFRKAMFQVVTSKCRKQEFKRAQPRHLNGKFEEPIGFYNKRYKMKSKPAKVCLLEIEQKENVKSRKDALQTINVT